MFSYSMQPSHHCRYRFLPCTSASAPVSHVKYLISFPPTIPASSPRPQWCRILQPCSLALLHTVCLIQYAPAFLHRHVLRLLWICPHKIRLEHLVQIWPSLQLFPVTIDIAGNLSLSSSFLEFKTTSIYFFVSLCYRVACQSVCWQDCVSSSKLMISWSLSNRGRIFLCAWQEK